MKQKISNLLIIIVFIGMIIFPQVLSWILEGSSQTTSVAENRNLSKKPELELATITKYPEQFDAYYNDHLPFRKKLISLWTNINYDVFNTTVDSRVVIGKAGWLFYRGNDSIGQVQGISMYSNKEKQDILDAIKYNADKLKERDIEMYVFIVPNKENMYKEYLPDNIPIKSDTSKTEELIEYIKDNSDINIIYPKEELKKSKKNYQIFKKHDTHWNDIGACVGTIVLQENIDSNFKYRIDEMIVEQEEKADSNDLANFANLSNRLYENKMTVKNFYTEIECEVNVNEQYEEYTSTSSNDKVVLFIGDSFRTNMKEYFSKLYRKVIYIHKDKYKENLIEDIKPDIVIYEAVERYTGTLTKKLVK